MLRFPPRNNDMKYNLPNIVLAKLIGKLVFSPLHENFRVRTQIRDSMVFDLLIIFDVCPETTEKDRKNPTKRNSPRKSGGDVCVLRKM